jgi:hypothetical protein
LAVRASAGAWSLTALPPDSPVGNTNYAGVAVSPDGTVYVTESSLHGQALVAVRDGVLTRTLLDGGPGILDGVATGPDGTPHACYTNPAGVFVWTLAGPTLVIPSGPGELVFACAIAVAPNGDVGLIAGAAPLVGGSCLIGSVCASTPGAGNLVSAVETAKATATATRA